MPSMRAVLDARKAGGDGLGARRPAVVLGWDSTSASRIEGAKARRKRLVERAGWWKGNRAGPCCPHPNRSPLVNAQAAAHGHGH